MVPVAERKNKIRINDYIDLYHPKRGSHAAESTR